MTRICALWLFMVIFGVLKVVLSYEPVECKGAGYVYGAYADGVDAACCASTEAELRNCLTLIPAPPLIYVQEGTYTQAIIFPPAVGYDRAVMPFPEDLVKIDISGSATPLASCFTNDNTGFGGYEHVVDHWTVGDETGSGKMECITDDSSHLWIDFLKLGGVPVNIEGLSFYNIDFIYDYVGCMDPINGISVVFQTATISRGFFFENCKFHGAHRMAIVGDFVGDVMFQTCDFGGLEYVSSNLYFDEIIGDVFFNACYFLNTNFLTDKIEGVFGVYNSIFDYSELKNLDATCIFDIRLGLPSWDGRSIPFQFGDTMSFHHQKTYIINNLFICDSDADVKHKKIEVFPISQSNFEWINNLHDGCMLSLHETVDNTCGHIEVGHYLLYNCSIAYNYYYNWDYHVRGPVFDYDPGADGVYLLQYETWDDILQWRFIEEVVYTGDGEKKPSPYYIPKTVLLGLDFKTPAADMAGRIRGNTMVPSQAGPLGIYFCHVGSDCYDLRGGVFNGSCWAVIYDTSVDQVKAEQICSDISCTLASIHSVEENSFLSDVLLPPRVTGNLFMWIGLENDVLPRTPIVNPTYSWSDGSTVDYAHSEQEIDSNGETCTVMKYDGSWNDELCSSTGYEQILCKCNIGVSWTCNGIPMSNSSGCTLRGNCTAQDFCECENGWKGRYCDEYVLGWASPSFEVDQPTFVGTCSDEFVVSVLDDSGYDIRYTWNSSISSVTSNFNQIFTTQWIDASTAGPVTIDVDGFDYWGQNAPNSKFTVVRVADDTLRQATIDGCNHWWAPVYSPQYAIFGWSPCELSQDHTFVIEQTSGESVDIQVDGPRLLFPTGFPFNESTYEFSYTIVHPWYNDTTFVRVSTYKRNLIVKFNDTSRDVKIGEIFVVSVNGSLDPEHGPDADNFTWFCVFNESLPCPDYSVCADETCAYFNPSGPGDYEVVVMYSKDSRTELGGIKYNAEYMSAYVPTIQILDPYEDPRYLKSIDYLRLTATIEEFEYDYLVEFSWSSSHPDLASIASSFDLNNTELMIKPDTLMDGQVYTFTLNAKFDGNIVSYSKDVQFNTPPCCGEVFVTPREGVVLEDWIYVHVQGWEDEHMPILYGVDYIHPIEGEYNWLHPFGCENTFRFQSQVQGCRNKDYVLTLRIRIKDYFHAETHVFVNITSRPTTYSNTQQFFVDTKDYVMRNIENTNDRLSQRLMLKAYNVIAPKNCDELTADELNCMDAGECDVMNIQENDAVLFEIYQAVCLGSASRIYSSRPPGDITFNPSTFINVMQKIIISDVVIIQGMLNGTITLIKTMLERFDGRMQRSDIQTFVESLEDILSNARVSEDNDPELYKMVREIGRIIIKNYAQTVSISEDPTLIGISDTDKVKMNVKKDKKKDFDERDGKTYQKVGKTIEVSFNNADILSCSQNNYSDISSYAISLSEEEVQLFWSVDGTFCDIVFGKPVNITFSNFTNPSTLKSVNHLTCIYLDENGKNKKCPRNVSLGVGIECRCRAINTVFMVIDSICNGTHWNDSSVCGGVGDCPEWDFCNCPPGYHGEFCEFCDTAAFCSVEGTVSCSNSMGSTTCNCKTNYTGSQCELPICYGKTDPLVCNEVGTCVSPNNCSCGTDYFGDQCQNCDVAVFCSSSGTDHCSMTMSVGWYGVTHFGDENYPGGSHLVLIEDIMTGTFTHIGPIGFDVNGLAWDPWTSKLYGTTSNYGGATSYLIEIDVTTGTGVRIGPGTVHMNNPTIQPSTGQMYVWSESGDRLGKVDKTTGVFSTAGFLDPAIGTMTHGLAFDAVDGKLYLAIINEGVYEVNPITGGTTLIGNISSNTCYHGDFEETGSKYIGVGTFGMSSSSTSGNFPGRPGVGSAPVPINVCWIDMKVNTSKINFGPIYNDGTFNRYVHAITRRDSFLGAETCICKTNYTGTTCDIANCPSSSSCNFGGICLTPNNCTCNSSFYEPDCEICDVATFYSFPVSVEDIRTKLGSEKGGIVGDLESTYRRTITNACENKFWGLAIDTKDRLWVWGEGAGNDHIQDSKITPKEAVVVDTSSWIGVPSKAVCTESSLFVLTHSGHLYIMGKNTHHELDGGVALTTFTFNLDDVVDVEASYYTVYVSMNQRDSVRYIVKVIGYNYYGCFGVDTWARHSGDAFDTYMSVDLQYAPRGVRPHINAFEYGVVLRYPICEGSLHEVILFAGKDHPSRGDSKVRVPFPIDVSYQLLLDEIHIDNRDRVINYCLQSVEFVDRLIGGCLVIITRDRRTEETRIFTKGRNCPYGLRSDPRNPEYPIEISGFQYRDFTKGERVFSLKCGYACFITTQRGVYLFGRSDEFGVDCGLSNNCDQIRFVSDPSLLTVIPGLAKSADDSEFSSFYFERNQHVDIDAFSEDKLNQSSPELLHGLPLQSYLSADGKRVILKFRKKEIFMAMPPTINFDCRPNVPADKCIFPKTGQSEWIHWNDDVNDGKGSYDYYLLNMSWADHRDFCMWEQDVNDPKRDIWRTTLIFTEHFNLGNENSCVNSFNVNYSFPLEVRFPKVDFSGSSATDLTKPREDRSWWDISVDMPPEFERDSMKGKVVLRSKTDVPNFLVRVSEAISAFVDEGYSHLGTNSDSYKKQHDFLISNKLLFDNTKKGPSISQIQTPRDSRPKDVLSGGTKKTYKCESANHPCGEDEHYLQSYQLDFKLFPDVCNVDVNFEINWVQFCNIERMSDEYRDERGCGDIRENPYRGKCPSREVSFDLAMTIFDLCGSDVVDCDPCFHGNLLSDCVCVCDAYKTGNDCSECEDVTKDSVALWLRDNCGDSMAATAAHKIDMSTPNIESGVSAGNIQNVVPSDVSGDRREEQFTPSRDNFDIAKICQNKYWGAFIGQSYNQSSRTSRNELFIFGSSFGNDYITFDNGVPVNVDTSHWNGVPVDVVCTRSSIYVRTSNGRLYFLGRNEFGELEGNEQQTSFQLSSETLVRFIVSSYHTVYIILLDTTLVDFTKYGSVMSMPVYRIKSIGGNQHGCLGSRHNLENSQGRFIEISYDFVSSPSVTDYSDYPFPKPDQFVRFGSAVMPSRIRAFEHGALMTYRVDNPLDPKRDFMYHFFVGKDHPSVGHDTGVFTLIDFSSVRGSELRNDDSIDHVDRINGGNLFIISNSHIFVSGESVGDINGPISFSAHPEFPYELTPAQYNQFDWKSERVFYFTCEDICYVVTKSLRNNEFNTYVFGKINNGIGFEALCENDHCQQLEFASANLHFVQPVMMVDKVHEGGLVEMYDTLYVNKTVPFRHLSDHKVFEYPPEIVRSDSGFVEDANIFRVVLKKPIIFGELVSEIFFSNGFDSGLKSEYECNYQRSSESFWRSYSDNDNHYFVLELPWRDLRVNCAFGNVSTTSHKYDEYFSRLHFTENFYDGYRDGFASIRRENFYFDVKIRFPKEILSTSIVVHKTSDFWDAYVVDKMFDRDQRSGKIIIAVVTDFPNFFVFPERAVAALPNYHHFPEGTSSYSHPVRIGGVIPNQPVYFDPSSDVFFLEELGSTITTPFSDKSEISCDSKSCYQEFELHFRIIDDPRVCKVPSTDIPLHFVQFCLISEMSDDYYSDGTGSTDHEDCVAPSQEVELTIKLEIDNLCGGKLIENLDAVYSLEIYRDWTYSEIVDVERNIFEVADWLYFKASVVSSQVSVESVHVSKIDWILSNVRVLRLFDSVDGNSDFGSSSQLVIDDLPTLNDVGFHFKLSNEITDLQPGEKGSFSVEVFLSVLFRGNDRFVTSDSMRRGDVVSIGSTELSRKVDLQIVRTNISRFSLIPYFVSIMMLICASLACVVGFVTIAFLLLKVGEKLKKKQFKISRK